MYTCIYTDISYLLKKKTCLYIKCYTNPFCCLATWVAQTVDNQGSLTGARRQHWSWQTLGLLRGHHPVMLARPITCQSRCTWARRGGTSSWTFTVPCALCLRWPKGSCWWRTRTRRRDRSRFWRETLGTTPTASFAQPSTCCTSRRKISKTPTGSPT